MTLPNGAAPSRTELFEISGGLSNPCSNTPWSSAAAAVRSANPPALQGFARDLLIVTGENEFAALGAAVEAGRASRCVLGRKMMSLVEKLIWTAVAVVGAVAFAVVALTRGEPVNAAWLVVAAVCIYFIAYRFYALFIVDQRARRRPEARRRRPTGTTTASTTCRPTAGSCSAIISPRSPARGRWSGPVLAAQMGYLPGTLWILAGVVFAGAVQDMTVLFLSMRRDGKSLGEMIRTEIGPVAGSVVGVGMLAIMIILLAVLALVVVNALSGSPWGAFTVFCTIPIALIMGLYRRFIRPGRVGEMSLIGVVLLLASLVYGQTVSRDAGAGGVVHAERADAGAGRHRLRLLRVGPAGVAAARAARLSLDLPEDRHHRRCSRSAS